MSCPICDQKPMNCDCTEAEIQLHDECESLIARVSELEEEVRIDNKLITERDKLLNAIPECSVHGKCVPHALEWISERKSKLSHEKRISEYLASKLVKKVMPGYSVDDILQMARDVTRNGG